jgi:hypothetical protein
MKTYLAVGVGDFVCIDSLLTKEEKESISEIYWGCRFGYAISELLSSNICYPNLKKHHIVPDEVGKSLMNLIEPNASEFWHFRPDFAGRAEMFLRKFSINRNEVNIIDAAAILSDPSRKFIKSSIVDNCLQINVHNLASNSYILLHYPTSTRPRSDIARITNEEWTEIIKFSKNVNKKLVIITDVDLDLPSSEDIMVLKNSDIKSYPYLVKNCYYYMGCDSFIAGMAAKCLPANKISIKSHDPHVDRYIETTRGSKYFLPHSVEEVKSFYKPFFEYKLWEQ